MSSNAQTLRTNMAASMERRPAIANGATAPTTGNRQFDGRKTLGNAARIKIERIRSDPDQPRKTFGTEADARLAENMRIRGQLVPILVRWDAAADRYLVIDGDRRFRAATAAGLADLACVVEDEADPDAILEMQLIANALREDVAPVEQARSWERLMQSQNLTHRQLAAKLGYDHTMVNKALALLDLPPAVQADVDAGRIAASTGSLIAKVADPAEQQALADRVVAEGLNRAEVAEVVRQVEQSKPTIKGGASGAKARAKGKQPKLSIWPFQAGDGLKITAERIQGIEPSTLADALERFAGEIRATLVEAGRANRQE